MASDVTRSRAPVCSGSLAPHGPAGYSQARQSAEPRGALGGAFVYGAAIHWLDLGTVSGGYGDSTGGLLYLSGVTYATLGFTQQVVEGPLRLMTMVNALTGFMLITWSATYVYSIWGQYYRDESGD
jgi:hypothetical protein